MQRHLQDLVTRTFEGAAGCEERAALFERAVEPLDPVRSFEGGWGVVPRTVREHGEP